MLKKILIMLGLVVGAISCINMGATDTGKPSKAPVAETQVVNAAKTNSTVKKGTILRGKATKISDGDTITIEQQGVKYRIRFYGIDAPESSQVYGAKSRLALENIIKDKELKIVCKDKDRYGRIVGQVYSEEQDVNLAMLKLGAAWFYEQYARDNDAYRQAAAQAKREKIGLWSNPNPQNPSAYRREHKKQNVKRQN